MKIFDSVKNGNTNQFKKESKEMNAAPQELLKEYVKSQHFTSTAEIMAAMKEMFRDVVQTAMEVELDEALGRERCQRAETSGGTPNYRNGYSRKTVKTQLGEVDSRFPGTGTEPLSRRSSANTAGTRTGWRRRFWPSTPAG